jgi:sec-independent protein translocase protein TatB
MFDIGFTEIVVLAVVALVVLGPERLPKTARTLGHLFGRLQRYVADVKADINREIELDELRKLQQQVRAAAKDIETSVATAAGAVESSARAVESSLNAASGDATSDSSTVAPAAASVPLAEPPVGSAPQQASLPGFERG